MTENNNKLNEEQLTEVTGGHLGNGSVIIGQYELTGLVGMYDAARGQNYYIVYSKSGKLSSSYGYGTLVITYEESTSGGGTQRVHEFNITNVSDESFYSYGTIGFQGHRKYIGTEVSLYTTATLV